MSLFKTALILGRLTFHIDLLRGPKGCGVIIMFKQLENLNKLVLSLKTPADLP